MKLSFNLINKKYINFLFIFGSILEINYYFIILLNCKSKIKKTIYNFILRYEIKSIYEI